MSARQVSVDDPEVLHRILANTEALLLDFDGPVCSVFAGIPAHLVAQQLRGVLADEGHDELPAEIEKAEDPFDVLRYAATLGCDETRYVEASMCAHEVEAVSTAAPTPGAHDLIQAWHATGRRLAVVSNNSAKAVAAYLHLHKLEEYVSVVSARTEPDPSLLKPSSYLVDQAVDALALPPGRCCLVGDSTTDVHAGHAAGTSVIGYANKPGKVAMLVAEAPQSIVTGMIAILHAI